jgi:WW domain-containing oxidoreductase
MSVVSLLKGKGKSGFGYGSTAEEVTDGLDLSGKRYLITGCTSGLGAEAMRVLAMHGADVVGTARDLDKAKAACAPYGVQAIPLACELSEPTSVRECVERAGAMQFDGIVANAGIMALPELSVKHGLELQFLTNHMGHFLLVTGLLPRLMSDGRVVILSSSAHNMAPKSGIEFDNLDGKRGYDGWKAYGQSKLSNLLFAKELARRLPAPQQTANAVHPGVINTGLQRNMSPFLAQVLRFMGPIVLKSVPEGAATEVFVATHPSVASTKGEYFADCNIAKTSALGRDQDLALRLWEKSEELAAQLGR